MGAIAAHQYQMQNAIWVPGRSLPVKRFTRTSRSQLRKSFSGKLIQVPLAGDFVHPDLKLPPSPAAPAICLCPAVPTSVGQPLIIHFHTSNVLLWSNWTVLSLVNYRRGIQLPSRPLAMDSKCWSPNFTQRSSSSNNRAYRTIGMYKTMYNDIPSLSNR